LKLRALFLIAAACLLPACGDDSSGGGGTNPTPTRLSFSFVGSLDPGGVAFTNFTVQSTGVQTEVMFGSMTNSAGNVNSSVMAIGLGSPTDTECVVSSGVEIAPSLTTQLRSSLAPGNYCVRIADTGNLNESVRFAIRVVHP
jgi:hypothetical protein